MARKVFTAVMTNGEIAKRTSETRTYTHCVQVTDLGIDVAIRSAEAARSRATSPEFVERYTARIAELEARKAAGQRFASDALEVVTWCGSEALAAKQLRQWDGLNGRVATVLEVIQPEAPADPSDPAGGAVCGLCNAGTHWTACSHV